MVSNRGQAVLVGIMIFVFAFVAMTVLMRPLFDVVDDARSPTQMNCVADNLSTGTAAACIVVDITPAFFIAIVIAGAGSFITRALVKGG